MAGVVTVSASRAAMRRARTIDRGVSRAIGFLLIPVILLVVLGLGTLLSASSVVGLREAGDGLYYFKRQVVWLVGGVVAMVVAAWIPLRWWRRMSFPLFFGSVGLLAAVVFFGIRANGATRWLSVGPVAIQPSEIAKLTTVLFLATLVSRREHLMDRFWTFAWPLLCSVGVVGALVMLQPDLGTTLLVAVGCFAILMVSSVPLSFILGGCFAAASAAFALAYVEPYRWQRVTAFLDLERDPLGQSYQAVQSLVALGSGGWWGVGLGASRARWSFLPNAHTDFVFAILGEETGLAGSLSVIALFVAFTIAGLTIARRCTDRFGRLVAIGVTTWISAQALINIGGVTGVLPITGVPLPFVSFGGSALVVSLVAVGLLVSVARHPTADLG